MKKVSVRTYNSYLVVWCNVQAGEDWQGS